MFEQVESYATVHGNKLGRGENALLNLNRALIRPVIECGMEAYFFSSVSTSDKIHIVQFKALHSCTGGMRSAP